jgi:peptide/nickel transport system substrate-binding protein
MRKHLLACILILAASAASAQGVRKGPIADRISVDVRTEEEAAPKEAADGTIDLFAHGVPWSIFASLPKEMKDRLEVYTAPAGILSILINPVPDAPPYTVTVGGATYFNPFAIREVRYAMNFLLDRKRIATEILKGFGGASFTPAAPGLPGASRYNFLAAAMGITAAGDESRALADITAALSRASALPQLSGALTRNGGAWSFTGKPLAVRLLIRADDPDGRLPEGRYVADQIEKAGIEVERLEYDEAACRQIVSHSNPGDYTWNLYTEGWGAGGTRRYWDSVVSQMYAPSGGAMPGGRTEEFWGYTNDQIDRLTAQVQSGRFLDANDYWSTILKAQQIGLTEAVRIFVCWQSRIFAANKTRFNAKMLSSLGEGIDRWSLLTADVKPEPSGEKILRVSAYTPRDSLSAGVWDPVGVEGFGDEAGRIIADACTDQGSFSAPLSGADTPWRAVWKNVQTVVEAGRDPDGNEVLVGRIPVPEDAMLYDSGERTWKKAGPGVTSFSAATYTYIWGTWHTGRPITIADIMYCIAFVTDWSTRDAEADTSYDTAYESVVRQEYSIFKGITPNKDGTVTAYFDYNAPDPDRVGARGALYLSLNGGSSPAAVSWEIAEALARLVSEGGASGRAYGFSLNPGRTEVDVREPGCVADIRAKLAEMKAALYVPPSITRWMTPASAAASYQAAIDWIDAHGHAYISNGPFYLDSADRAAGRVQLAAFRAAGYPYETTYWSRRLSGGITRIDDITMPAAAPRTKDARILVKASVIAYPSGAVSASGAVKVKLTLVSSEGEKAYAGVRDKSGQFTVTIPAADLKKLKAGSYRVVAESSLSGEPPDIESAVLTVQ